MSILLDALRKSEQQKKLGMAPGIHDMEPLMHERRRPVWIMPAILVVLIAIVLIGSYMTWRSFLQPTSLPSGTSPAVTQEPQSSRPTPQQGAPGQDQQAAASGESPGVSAPIAGRVQPDPRLTAQPRSPVESLSGDRPYQAARSTAAPSAGTEAPGEASADSNDSDPGRVAASTPSIPVASAPASSTTPRRPVAAQEPAARNEQNDDGAISFWQLPESVREQMPELKITVLVYDEIPRNRFVLISGKRLQVGDTLDNVRLISILRDRAIFRFGAYRFFVTQR